MLLLNMMQCTLKHSIWSFLSRLLPKSDWFILWDQSWLMTQGGNGERWCLWQRVSVFYISEYSASHVSQRLCLVIFVVVLELQSYFPLILWVNLDITANKTELLSRWNWTKEGNAPVGGITLWNTPCWRIISRVPAIYIWSFCTINRLDGCADGGICHQEIVLLWGTEVK